MCLNFVGLVIGYDVFDYFEYIWNIICFGVWDDVIIFSNEKKGKDNIN